MENSRLAKIRARFGHGKSSTELSGHRAFVHCVAWNCSGTRLASGSKDGSGIVWAPDRSNKPEIQLNGHRDNLDQLCWDPLQPEVLATASADKTVKIWDTRASRGGRCECSKNITTKGQNINIAWHPAGHHIAVGNKDDVISIIDVRTGHPVEERRFDYEANEIRWNKQGDLFFLTTGSGRLEVYRYSESKSKPLNEKVKWGCPSSKNHYFLTSINGIFDVAKGHSANMYCIAFDLQGRHFATGGADAMVGIWDCENLICLRTVGRLDFPIRTLSISHDGRFVSYGSEDLFIDVADIESGDSVFYIPTEYATNCLVWHPKELILAYSGESNKLRPEATIKIFRVPDG